MENERITDIVYKLANKFHFNIRFCFDFLEQHFNVVVGTPALKLASFEFDSKSGHQVHRWKILVVFCSLSRHATHALTFC